MDAILTFHAIDGSGSVVSFPRDRFERLVTGLLDDGVAIVPLRALRREAPGHRVALTFDDGYRSVLDEALPVLARHALPALAYVVSSWVGRDVPAQQLMGWAELRAWKAQGFEVGAHTASHVPLRDLSEAQWAEELSGCRARLEDELGSPVDDFAYPYGVAPRAAREHVAAVFGTAVTARLDFARPGDDPLRLPRIDAYYLRALPPLFAAGTRARLALRRAGRSLRAVLGRGPG